MSNLLTDTRGRIRYITINRESKLNALNRETLDELNLAFKDAFSDRAIGGVILTGAGSKAFVAGADITEFAGFGIDEGRELARKGQDEVFNLIQNGNKPVIAAVNGFALGGGLELAMACHIRVAADTAKMGLPEVSLGLIPGYGGTQRLTQLAGKGRTLEMILSAEMITAEDAYRMGLVNHVTNAGQLIEKAESILEKILKNSPAAISSAISAVNASLDPQKNGYEIEISEFASCFGSEDFKKGVSAFLEKRKPQFGRS